MNAKKAKVVKTKFKSDIEIIIERNYDSLIELLSNYKEIKGQNGKLISLLREHNKYQDFYIKYGNESLIRETKTPEPVLEIPNEDNYQLKENKNWYLTKVCIFYNKRIEWYKKFLPILKELNRRLKYEITMNKLPQIESRGQKNVPFRDCNEKCIAFCPQKKSECPPNHMAFYDMSSGLALDYIKDNYYSILLESKVMNKIPNNFPIAIDIENFPSETGAHFAARIAIITNTTDRSKKKSDFVIALHALLNFSDKSVNKKIPKEFICINVKEHENNVKSINRHDVMGFVSELFRSHKVIFKNFGTDFLSLLNSGLELDQNFINYEFYEIQNFYITDSGQKDRNDSPIYKPLSLDWLRKYVLLRINEKEPKHDPIIDASNHLLLFNKIPVNERSNCKVNEAFYEQIVKNHKKLIKK